MAVSPGGSRVFVTGYSNGPTTGDDYATIAYSAATGRRLWVRRYNGPGDTDFGLHPDNSTDTASSVAVSPNGQMVFVTGSSDGRTTGTSAYATVAYSAATGRQLWVARYNGPENVSGAHSVAVSPAGSTVFVTGSSLDPTTHWATTVAYSAATGRQLWVSRYNGPANSFNAVTVSPNGQMVFVTGTSIGRTSRLRHGRVQRRHRQAAVGQALQQRQRIPRMGRLYGREPGRDQGVRNRVQPGPTDPHRLRDGGLQRRHRQAAVGQALLRLRERRRVCVLDGSEPRRGQRVCDRGQQ